MGEVYKARDTRLDRTVAIKVVRADLVDDPHRFRRFEQEARSAAAFHHPNIAVLHEIGENDGHHFIVMEYVEGQTLSRVIGGRPLPVTQLLDLGVQLAEALEEARSKGVVHRDIKPANIMVTPRGRVKILDFGLAKTAMVPRPDDVTATTVESMTQAGVVMGTIPYMSPEQALGQPVDHRSDLFSLGLVLYEMATGKRPFDGPTTMALLNEIINKAPAPASELNPALPAALDPVLCKILEKDARQRYQTAADLLSDLQKLQRGGESGQSVAPPQPPSPAASNPSRLRTLILASAGVAAAGGIVWFGFFRQAGGSPVVQPAGYNLTQVTRDSGLTYQPGISGDGNFVVYASDRATGADLDIWLQHVSGGQPVRLTATPGNEFRPSLSADGRMAAFEASGGQQSGIFVVPALGGSARQVALSGFDARISPDGSSVAYATGWYTQDSEIRLVSAEGGSDRKVSTGLAWAMAPQWTPDGKNLLLWSRLAPSESWDYWVVPASGGVAKKSGAMEQLQGAQSMLMMPFQRDPSPVASVGANGMVVAARSGDGHDLWFSPLSSSGRADSPAIRITTGAGAANPSVSANGKIAFARLSVSSGLWMLPLQAASGRITGELTRVWRENVTVSHPNVSADGKTLVYVSDRGGDADVWARDLPTGVDRQLTATKFDEYRAVISPDGTRVAFTRPENGRRRVITMPSGGGAETVACETCGSVQQWSPDGASILYSGTQRTRFSLLDVKTGQTRDFLWHPEGHIHNGRLSPDGRWVTFTLVKGDSREVYVSSIENAAGKPETWIRLSVTGRAESSFWSPDGNLVYIHQEDRLWARKVHPTTKAPVGDAFLVQLPPGQRFTAIFSANGLTRDALYFVMNEATSNIWLAEPAGR